MTDNASSATLDVMRTEDCIVRKSSEKWNKMVCYNWDRVCDCDDGENHSMDRNVEKKSDGAST